MSFQNRDIKFRGHYMLLAKGFCRLTKDETRVYEIQDLFFFFANDVDERAVRIPA